MEMKMPNLMGHKYVLAVDDSSFVREVLATIVQQSGHCVIKAENGAEGLKKAQSQFPDFIILDVKMPEMGGLEVLDKLRADPHFKETPIVMLTSFGDLRLVRHAISRGANDYILKEDSEQMAQRLKTFLQ